MLKEFREFAVKGNMLDLAIGLIIGAAFGAIVTSLVKDIIMPPIGMLVGQVDFNELKYTLKPADALHKLPVTINYGTFLNLVINFVIIAFAAFMIVKAFNRFKEKKEEAPPEPSKQEVLLTEIRDLLAKK